MDLNGCKLMWIDLNNRTIFNASESSKPWCFRKKGSIGVGSFVPTCGHPEMHSMAVVFLHVSAYLNMMWLPTLDENPLHEATSSVVGEPVPYTMLESLFVCFEHGTYKIVCFASLSTLGSLVNFPFSNTICHLLGLPWSILWCWFYPLTSIH